MNNKPKKKIYISGPVSNNPSYRMDFERTEKTLLVYGFDVVNPVKNVCAGQEWAWCMKRDIKLLMDCDAIFMMNGWRTSAGAVIEHDLAVKLSMEVINENEAFNFLG